MKMQEFVNKQKYNFNDLCEIMAILRGENGCPWDKIQTHKSIRKNLIEETYEVVEAIDNNDYTLLCEELGDLMLQVVFHARMASEEEHFDINDVCDGICKKLIVRHPHIFADVKADTPDVVLKNWEEIKKSTKADTRKSPLDGIPPSLPSLMRAAKAAKKAKDAGLIDGDAVKVTGDIALQTQTLTENLTNIEKLEKTAGKLLFDLSRLCQLSGIDAEEALGKQVDDFIENCRNKQ